MDVIWQDQNARVIHFCDEYGNYSDATDNSYHGFGLNPAYITLDQTTLDNTYNGSLDSYPKKDIYGNILVGVRKPNESTYLWSWHLWVTDYCPDYAPTYNSGYGGIYNTGIDYQGYIRIDGLMMDSQVKITDAYGSLIHEGTSIGGSFSWNGRNAQGQRVASGVYHVMATDEEGQEGIVTKIVMIR